jgi:two-component system KDP operon response regulator KdpE
MQLVLELAGHQVTTAGTGKEALERAAEDHPDAVLLDLRLPDQSGQAVSKALRAQGPPVPRIIITSGSSLEPGEAARYGADAVLQKPFEPDQMLAALR